jgi:hypothetical protein
MEVSDQSPPIAAAAAAAAEPFRCVGAVLDVDTSAAAAGSEDVRYQIQRQQQQQQRQQQPCCGPGRGFGTPAAHFYGGGVGSSGSSRDGVVASYYGHRNAATVKGVSYFGEGDEYVISGSDCGHVFVWSKAGGEIVWWAAADEEVVNCLEPHPLMPHVLATSGELAAAVLFLLIWRCFVCTKVCIQRSFGKLSCGFGVLGSSK